MTSSLIPALLMTAATLGGSPRGVVLDFSATWCGPCQQMNPIVSRLERQGYAIRKVDIDQEKPLADRFGITSIPAFVLVVDGKEVTRVVGATSEEQLRRLLAQIPSDPPPVAATPQPRPPAVDQPIVQLGDATRMAPRDDVGGERPAPASMTQPVSLDEEQPVKSGNFFGRLLGRHEEPQRETAPAVIRGNDSPQDEPISLLPVRDPLRASVRVHVTINGQPSVGSGTAIDSRTGRTVLITCGHLFKGWTEQSKIEVDVFTEAGIQKYVGRLVNYNIDSDVGVVTIPTDGILATAEVPDVDGKPRTGADVVNIGCSGGAVPTQEAVQVTALNYFEGPDNIECTGVPVQGRSGGGLFNQEGQLIGVCIGADAQRQRGAYAGLLAIHDQLDAAGFSQMYQQSTPPSAGGDSLMVDQSPPIGDSTPFEPSTPAVAPAVVTEPAATQPSTESLASAVAGVANAEVICIIRDRTQPGAPSRVVIIDRPSESFLGYLSAEMNKTANNSAPSATQTNRIETPPASAPMQLADPQSMFRPTGESHPMFSNPGDPQIGERSRSGSLQPTALEEPFVPQRYVRTR